MLNTSIQATKRPAGDKELRRRLGANPGPTLGQPGANPILTEGDVLHCPSWLVVPVVPVVPVGRGREGAQYGLVWQDRALS